MRTHPRSRFLPAPRNRQSGVAAVEFALIALLAFIPLILGMVEVGRLFYMVNTSQEVTRRAARLQTVKWLDQTGVVQRYAVFGPATGTAALPAGPEVGNTNVVLTFYGSYADALSGSNQITGGSPQSNLANCIKNVTPCIRFVRASLQTAGAGQVTYTPMIGWFGTLLQLPLPKATVIMPAEALGLL